MARCKYQEWLTYESLLKLEAWARDGLTDEQIAKNIGISRSTLGEWKKNYSVISDALKKGKEVADIEVENALNKRALGGITTVKRPIKLKRIDYEEGKKVKEEEVIEYALYEEYTPPDTTAIIYWLKNRLPAKWRDKPVEDKEVDNGILNGIISFLNGGGNNDKT